MLPCRALIAAALLVAVSVFAAEDESVVLRGRVLAPAEQPVAGATVRLLPAGLSVSAPDRDPATWVTPVVARTAEDGTFSMTGPRAEAYSVRVEAPGFAPFSAEDVTAGATLDVRLVPGHHVAGRVLDEREKTPVAGARVLAWDLSALTFGAPALLETRSDEEGRFVFEHAPEGELHLEALSPAHARSAERRLDVPLRAGAAELVLFLRPGGRVSGRVVDPERRPLGDARVDLFAQSSGAGDSIDVGTRTRPDFVHSASDGSFDLEGVPAGKSYRASAVKPAWPRTRSDLFAVEPGGHARDIELQLSPQAVLALTLLDPEGEPAPTKLGIRLCPEGSLRSGDSCEYGGLHVRDEQIHVGDGGRHTVDNLGAGIRDVLIDPQGFVAVEREAVVLHAGETTDLGTIRLDRGRTLAGRVVDADGLGIAEAEVKASFDTARGNRWIEGRTDAEGRYELAGLGTGPLTEIVVAAKGYVRVERSGVPVEEARVDFTLERAGGVRGRAVRRAGGALPAFRVFVNAEAAEDLGFGRRPSRSGSERFTDPEGRFEVGDLAPGTYTVEVQPDGLARALRSRVKVTGGETVDLGRIEVDEGRTLRVRVVAGEDDKPVAGARVDVANSYDSDTFPMLIDRYEHGHSKPETDADGRFEAGGLVPGPVTVQVAHPDYAPQEQRVEIPEGTAPSETVVRLSQGGVVAGTVRDGAGQPVAEAGVFLSPDDPFSIESHPPVVTGPDGRYEIRRVRPGTYSAVCFIHGRDPNQHESKTAVVREGETTVVEFGEGARIVLSGTARRGERLLARVSLLFMRPDGDADPLDSTVDIAGHYEVALDLPGTWLVAAQEGRSFDSSPPVQIVVPDEPRASADLAFPEGAISGTIRDVEGQPVPESAVVGRPEGEGEKEWSVFGAQAETSGRYTLEGLSPGNYRLTATAPGLQSHTRHVVLGSEGPANGIDFVLERGRAMWGRVVDPHGVAVAEADVLVVPAGGDSTSAAPGRTDRLGTFRITAPAAGPLDVTVLARGWAPLRVSGVLPPERHDDPGLELRVGPGGTLRVRIVDATGRPLAGLRPVARPIPAFAGMDYLFLFDPVPPTDTGGESAIERLAPGDYEVRVAGREDDPRVRVTVLDGAESSVTLRLPEE
jgi:hypothetical protein